MIACLDESFITSERWLIRSYPLQSGPSRGAILTSVDGAISKSTNGATLPLDKLRGEAYYSIRSKVASGTAIGGGLGEGTAMDRRQPVGDFFPYLADPRMSISPETVFESRSSGTPNGRSTCSG